MPRYLLTCCPTSDPNPFTAYRFTNQAAYYNKVLSQLDQPL